MSYDGNFNVTQIQYPPTQAGQTSAKMQFNYQTPGQLYLASSRTDSLGNCGAYFYDPSGNLNTINSGQIGPCDGRSGGTATCDAYRGNPSGTCGASSQVSCTGAKPGELCWAQDGDGHRTTFAYDANGNLTTVAPPAPLGSSQITVDTLSRTTSITDGKGQKTTYSYDSLDRPVQILHGGTTSCASYSTCTVFQYDADGNLSSRTDVTGTTAFTYDHLNRLTVKSLPDSSTYCSGQSGITTSYDAVGNLTQYCDSGGAIAYRHDAANRIGSLAEPGGSCTGTISLCTTYNYDNDGRLLTLTYPGGATQSLTYDNDGNTTSVIGRDAHGGVITSFAYSYSSGSTDLNVIIGKVENDGLYSNLTTSYTYDANGRLKQAAQNYGTGCCQTWNYTYDAAGNRTSDPGGASTFNSANEITSSPSASSYAFDSNGALTSSSGGGALNYNAKNQTTSVTWGGGSLTGLTYAGAGQDERTAAGSTTFASSSLGLAIQKQSGSTAYFVRDPGGRLIGEKWYDGNHYYFLRDVIGSIVAVISPDGLNVLGRQVYDPYGNIVQSLGLSTYTPWGFAGGYMDYATRMIKFGSRYYDPQLGRFTQPDPAGLTPNYTYAADNPVNFTDPTGNILVCGPDGCGSDPLPPTDISPPAPTSIPSPSPPPAAVTLSYTSSPSPSPSPSVSPTVGGTVPPSAIASTMPPPPPTNTGQFPPSCNVPELVTGALGIIAVDLFYVGALTAAYRAGQLEVTGFMESVPVAGVFLAANALGVWLIADAKCQIHLG